MHYHEPSVTYQVLKQIGLTQGTILSSQHSRVLSRNNRTRAGPSMHKHPQREGQAQVQVRSINQVDARSTTPSSNSLSTYQGQHIPAPTSALSHKIEWNAHDQQEKGSNDNNKYTYRVQESRLLQRAAITQVNQKVIHATLPVYLSTHQKPITLYGQNQLKMWLKLGCCINTALHRSYAKCH